MLKGELVASHRDTTSAQQRHAAGRDQMQVTHLFAPPLMVLYCQSLHAFKDVITTYVTAIAGQCYCTFTALFLLCYCTFTALSLHSQSHGTELLTSVLLSCCLLPYTQVHACAIFLHGVISIMHFLLTQRCSRVTARACLGELDCSHSLKQHCSAYWHVVDDELV